MEHLITGETIPGLVAKYDNDLYLAIFDLKIGKLSPFKIISNEKNNYSEWGNNCLGLVEVTNYSKETDDKQILNLKDLNFIELKHNTLGMNVSVLEVIETDTELFWHLVEELFKHYKEDKDNERKE